MVGRQIAQYRVLERIGRGGMGAVYVALDETLEREVALKILADDLEDPQLRFRAEAVALARLNHSGITKAYDLFQSDGHWIMVMELVRGRTLEQMADELGMFTPKSAAQLCIQILEPLACAHDAGIVHRDLKPGNVMISDTGAVKIMDFGVARVEGSARLTQAGVMLGTPAYMAPEQVQGLDIDARADIYAMGVVLYRLLTAEFPFEATTPFAMTQSHVHEMPRPIEHVRPDVPVEVRDIVARALAKAPGDRFQSALEFRDALAGWLRPPHDSSPSRAPAVTQMMARPSTMGRGTSYPRPLQVAAAGVVSAGLVVGGISAAMWRHSPPGLPDPTRSVAVATFDSEPATPTGAATPPRKSVGVVQASVTGTTAGKTRRERPAAEVPDLQPTVPLTQFSNVKLLVVNDGRTKESGVLLTFSNRRLEAMPREGGTPAAILPYGGIAKATYVHARDPQWDPQLSSPAGKINVPGILGRLRHWLVVQTRTDHAILRLDGPDWAQVLTTFTARTGVAIDRPLAADRQRPESDQLGRPNRKP